MDSFLYLLCTGTIIIVYYLYSRYVQMQKWTKSLKGKVVLVTGSANGLGKELCFLFAREQCHLICVDCNEKANNETVQKLKEIVPDSIKIRAYTVDLTKSDQINAMKGNILKEFTHGIDYLINNAGIMWPCRLLDLTDDRLQRLIDTNFVSHFWLIRAFLPKMIEKNSGHIVSVASVMVHVPLDAFAPYRATKCGVKGLMESLTYELKAMNANIKTLLVYPSFMHTELLPKKIYDLGTGIKFLNNVPVEITSPVDVAQNILSAIKDERRTVYIPYHPYIFLLVLQILPEFLRDLAIKCFAQVQHLIDPLSKIETKLD